MDCIYTPYQSVIGIGLIANRNLEIFMHSRSRPEISLNGEYKALFATEVVATKSRGANILCIVLNLAIHSKE